MSTISRIKTWSTSDTLTAADLNAEFNNIVNDYNGSISNANIASDAAIAYSKLSLTGSVTNADLAGSIDKAKISNTAVTLSDTQTISGVKTFSARQVFQKATKQALNTASDGATVTFDLNEANLHEVTLGGNRTLALSNASTGQVFVIRLVQDGTGSRTVDWFSGISWPAGTAPTLSTAADAIDVFGFICTGTDEYDGFTIGQNLS